MHVKVENTNQLEKEWNLLIDNKNEIFDFLQDNLSSGIWYWDIENTDKKWFNAKFWSVLGYRKNEAKYTIEDWKLVVHPDDYLLFNEKFKKHLKNPKKPFDLIIRFFHKDGSTVWLNCIGKSMHSNSDKPNRMLFIFKNVSETKLLEEKFIKLEGSFRQMNQAAKIGHWELDVIKNEVYWSDYCRIIHEVADDFIPDIINGIGFFNEGENRDRITQVLDKCIQEGIPFDEELQIVTANNNKIWIRLIGKPYFENGICQKLFGVIQDINEQKTQSLELNIMQNQFQLIFEYATVGMCMIDFEGYFINVNQSLCQILGYSKEEFLTFKQISITHHDDIKLCNQKNEELLSGTIDNCQMEKRYYHKNGQVVLVIISAHVVRNSKNEPQFIIKEIQDITERKNAEIALQKSEIQFRNIVENANDIIFILDPMGNFNYLSPNIEEKTGYKVEELLHKSISNLVHPDYMDFSFGALQKVVVTKTKQLSDDFIILHKNGATHWYQANGTPLFDEQGEIYAVLGIARDVTAFILSENALLQSEFEVNTIAKRYNSLLDNDSVYIIKVDINGNYSFVNNYFCSQFGVDQNIIGTSALQGIIEDDHSLCNETVMQCFSKPEVSHEVVLRKIMSDKAIGGSKWEFKGVLDSEGQVKEILCVGIDITNEVRSLEKAEHLLALTSKQNIQLKSFNYIVSHDIRSHAANITALVAIIPNVIDTHERESIFEMLDLSTHKLNETLDNLNQIISISEDTFKNYSEVKLLEELNKTLEVFSYQIKEFQINFLIEIDENLTITVVPAYLDSILLNLISNAIKYRSENRKLIVTIKAYKICSGIEITIADNGRGFDFEKNKDKIFGIYKTFHSGEDSRGFGLYITKSQIEVMGGKIAIESKENQGTTFTINFNE